MFELCPGVLIDMDKVKKIYMDKIAMKDGSIVCVIDKDEIMYAYMSARTVVVHRRSGV